jgi:hypothetical protein
MASFSAVRARVVLWPAFLAACMLEMLVFAFVDPQDLLWFGQPLPWSRAAVYTLAFFAFWLVAAAAGWVTSVLSDTPQQINGGS